MFVKPLKIEAHIAKRGLPIVTSGDKSKAGSIFSPDVFGVTDLERYDQAAAIPLNTYVLYGWALDEFKRIDRVIFECVTTKNKFLFTEQHTIIKVPKDYIKDSPDQLVGYGPMFLYAIWDRLDKTKYKKTEGKLANVLMSNSVLKYTRNELFTAFQYTIPIGFREEDQDSVMVFNETNQLLAEIAKFASLIKNNETIDTNDLKVYLQNKVFELYELNTRIYGSHGQIRSKMISRVVDSSARGVLLPGTFASPIIGESRFGTDNTGFPIFHLSRMYSHTTKKFFITLLDILFDHGCFDDDVSRDMLAVYDMEFIEKSQSQFEDNFFKVQDFPAIKSDGTYGSLNISITVDGEVIVKPLSWLEFFYIVLVCLADIENKRYAATTRYPVDSDKSCQILKPLVLTLSDDLLTTVDVLNFKDVKYFPLVNDYIRENYDQKIFESGIRSASTVVEAWHGDHDGDSVSAKPINSKEAVADGDNYHNSLLSLFNYTGDFSRKVGKCVAQTLYTFSREPKKTDKSKAVKPDHEFIKFILACKDGKMDTNELHKWTTVYGELTRPKISIYDTTTVKRLGKTVETTVGQLIINKIIFTRFWDTKGFDYIYLITNSGFDKLMRRLHQLCIEKKVVVKDIKRTVDLYCEFGLRMSTIYNPSLTEEMLNTDEVFKNYRDAEMAKVKDEIMKNNDIELLAKTTEKIIAFAKNYYKDNDMVELYESGGKSKWDGDFAAMQISLGGLATLTGDKPVIITDSLADGIGYEHMPDFCNTGL